MKVSKSINGGTFFAGANSARGFVSFYGDIFEDRNVKEIYILKGGPGTGKSSFMELAAKRGEERGLCVERYRCSSDPDSLDAVVIGERIAILDGTSPHSEDPRCAGAREEIINLGAFWDGERLAARYEEIERLGRSKAERYKSAYRYLEAYDNVRQINRTLALGAFKEEKAARAVDRVFSQIERGGGYRLSTGVICSVGMKGRVRYDTYEHFASKVYAIDDFFDLGYLYLRLLIKKAMQTDTPVRVSYDPVSAKEPDAVFFPNDRKAFVLSCGREDIFADSRINMKRFADQSIIGNIRNEYRLNTRVANALMDSAESALAEAGRYHFELERIYVECMDFEAKEVFCRNFLDNLI